MLDCSCFRDSLQIPRREVEPQHQRLVVLAEGLNVENDFPECASAAGRGASCCRSLALTVSFYFFNLLYNENLLQTFNSKSLKAII